jgi:pyrimidine-nucleoside phosphorylase
MNIRQIIIRKRSGQELDNKEIEFFVRGFTAGGIPDYAASSFLMAVYFRGMTEKETFFLTRCMMNSGEIYDLGRFGRRCVDKHSTGGVGDKVSLVCGPIVASLGVKVPMICGRGLGYTGGTVDKLESIPGFCARLTHRRFMKGLEKIGLVFSSQTGRIAPADKKIYALRDVTGTVENISLITSSIMSKKLATGAPGIVFDVKCGRGAFMKKKKEAGDLALWLVKVCRKFGRKATVLITDMDQPLGTTVGNSLEVIESVECLKGHAAPDLLDVSLRVSAEMLVLSGACRDLVAARQAARRQIENGEALRKLGEVITFQGGDTAVISEGFRGWKKARHISDIRAEKTGFIQDIDAGLIGQLACELGAGRNRLEDRIDPSAGLIFFCKKGNRVQKGETIARAFTDRRDIAEICGRLKRAVLIAEKRPVLPAMILKRITS